MDEDFDRSQGLQSLPVRFGKPAALRISAGLHSLAFLSLCGLDAVYFRSSLALLTLAAIGGLLVLEQRMSDDVDLAFFKINAVLGFGILAFVATGAGGLS